MSTDPAPVPTRLPPRGADRVLGGVCSGFAARTGVDPWLVRGLAVLLLLVSGGTALVAYALAWVLMPPAGSGPAAGTTGAGPALGKAAPAAGSPADPPTGERPPDVRTAWSAVGADLRSLAGELGRPAAEPRITDVPAPRTPPLEAADRVATDLGARLRSPGVRAAARQATTRFGEAFSLSAEELARRSSRR